MTTDSWESLRVELDAWQAAGMRATFWWRDDDAGARSGALDHLLSIAEAHEAPLALAAVPTWLTDDTVARIRACPNSAILQHGYAHRNHEPASAKKSEFGASRDHDTALADLCAGRMTLADRGADGLAVLTPPWNRIAGALVPHLPSAGFVGLSAYQARHTLQPAPGLVQVNAHVDIIDWRGSRGFVGDDAALDICVTHLGRRRRGEADAAEPTGLLTHHAVHDPESWRFIEAFLHATKDHVAAIWPRIADLFAAEGEA